MEGYFKREDLTGQVIRDDWFYTGDIAEIKVSGDIKIVGRLKSEINHAGTKISPEEIDLLMEKHTDIIEACTFGVPDDVSGERVGIAIITGSQESRAALTERLKRWCAEQIRNECIPELWYFVSEIPKTERGKVIRSAMHAYCREHENQRIEK